MGYRIGSAWNDEDETRCLLSFKILESDNFPRGKQMKYCREMAKISNFTVGSISAKICNYKSVSGINKPPHVSENSIRIYNKYKSLSIIELEKIIDL